jgi:type IV secretory pathway VirB6-like protein
MDVLMDLTINKVTHHIWAAVYDGINLTQSFALSILNLLIVLELINEALNIASGKEFKLPEKLLTLALICCLIYGFPQLASGIWKAAEYAGNFLSENFTILTSHTKKTMDEATEAMNSLLPGGSLISKLKVFISTFPIILGLGISHILIGLSLIIILIFIAGAYTSLALTLWVGPVFIVFLMSPITRGIGVNWFNHILSYLLMIPMFGITLQICYNIYLDILAQSLTIIIGSTELRSGLGFGNLLMMIVAPLLCSGIVFHVPRIVSGLTHSMGATSVSATSQGVATSTGAVMATGKLIK